MPPPVVGNLVGVTAAGGTLAIGLGYYVVLTFVNQWGETVQSNEQTIELSGAQNAIQIPFTTLSSATSVNVYFGTASGMENVVTRFPVTASPITLLAASSASATPPPTSTAFLPDTDGSYLRASAVYRWLTDALRQGSRIANGLPDYSGFPSVINWATYTVTGEWVKMIQPWYDGYPVALSPTSGFFKRNNVTSSILAGWSVSFYNGQLGVEVWPQPARTATQTTLAAPMAATDIAATLTTTAGFLLPTYGMVRFGNEICGYNGINGSQLVGLIRGLGGTVPAPWPTGTVVNELNAFFQGRRVFSTQYVPGNAALNLPIPSGWDGILIPFLMSKFYETERDSSNAQRELKDFKDGVAGWNRMNRQIAGPIQAGSRDYQFVVFGGTRFGGSVIP